jgi:putative ABC transport system ATP-binding protein
MATDPADTKVVLACSGVVKTYGHGSAAVQALRGVDLEVRRGELLVLAGPSGCGKTTLLSILAGVRRRDGGSCRVLDADLDALPADACTRFRGRHIGFVYQSFNLIPTLTALENAAAPLIINGMARRQAIARAREELQRVGLDGRVAEAMPTELSGGQQQRVAIVRAMIHAPRLILCDEPTSALDRDSGHVVMELLRRLLGDGDRAIIVVTHDQRVHEFADRIAEMEDGRITAIRRNEASSGAPVEQSS